LEPLPELPLVSIVTPVLEQARTLRAAIDSVLAQDYPAIDYFVADGGSTDGSIEILRSFGDRVRWSSRPDRGQADAIASRFESARGAVFGWLNADDELVPGAVARAVAALRADPGAGFVYGGGTLLDERGAPIGPFAEVEPFGFWRLVHFQDFVLQPAAWFRADLYRASGGLDRDLRWGMDWDLWIRLASRAEAVHLPESLARVRVGAATKTATGGWRRIAELRRIASRHAGQGWTPGVRLYALGALEASLLRIVPRPLRFAVSGAVRRLALRIVTRLAAYPDGWLGPQGRLLLPAGVTAVGLRLEAHRVPEGRPLGVSIAAAGAASRRLRFERAGEASVELRLPAAAAGGPLPRHEVRIESDSWFTSPGDPRRLSVRLAQVTPLRRGPE